MRFTSRPADRYPNAVLHKQSWDLTSSNRLCDNSDAMKNEQRMVDIPVPPIIETAIIVRLVLPQDPPEEVDESVAEIKRLAWTAGARAAGVIVQRRPNPCPATLIGKGKSQELRALCDEVAADLVIVDGDLTPSQGSNLEEIVERKVVDRTQLILDIFAQRAQTQEAKHQVELAQLQYLLPRLAGRGSIMRQQGGIGVRGPGEQKLEVDRRVVRDRITRLRKELDNILRQRRIQRKQRRESGVKTVALVGYTNAGKSSLLNALTGAGVFVEDKLFATLSPTSRRRKMPSGRDVVFTDTVGFVRKLPHSLVAAFRATLEEVNEADLLLIVADASDPAVEEHLETVHRVLEEINAGEVPFIRVINKLDLVATEVVRRLSESPASMRHAVATLAVSAQRGDNLEQLLATIDQVLSVSQHRVTMRVPQRDAGVLARLRQSGRILHEHYEGNEILVDAEIAPALEKKFHAYIVDGKRIEP